jgi:hypothetical protein
MMTDGSSLRRLASMAGAVVLLLFVGAVITRGPARRDAQSPVYLSRASGLAGQTGAANPQLAGDAGVSGPYLAVAEPASFDGDIRQLKDVPAVKAEVRPELEASESEKSSRAAFVDSVLQAPAGPSRPSQTVPGLLQNFAGLSRSGSCTGGPCGSGWPPDTNGDVGPNHYVQVVNTSIGIFDKTGTLLVSMTLNTFFQGAPHPCDTNNNGDPVVLYDAQADRWIVTDFSWVNIDSGPHYECIAASKTGDPVSGGWWYYALQADNPGPAWFNDYPKLGVWPDGIYMSANMFLCSANCTSATYEGARAWAISPTQLYNGSVLTTVVFTIGSSIFSLLPSNFRGAAPPAGTPNYFVSNDIGVTPLLDVFKFHVDWTVPLSSTFTGPTQIDEAAYTRPPDTVPVLSGNAVDSLGDRLMMQNQYRNLSGDESLWIAHTAGSPTTGVRWYQLNVTGGTVSITPTQQSTYAPADGLNRWMPSLAVDKFGNMAVGYSAASGTHFADIRYAGRLVSDTLGTLGQDEAIMMAGSGAQNNSCGGGICTRWGDYSAMTVDPVDDCTFWYTTEYYAALGGNWQTRIGSFRYSICGPVPPPLAQTYLPMISIGNSAASGNWSTMMQEGFEGAWPSAGWQVADPGFGEYFWAKRNCRASSGSFSAWAIGGGSIGQGLSCGANYINGANSWMVYGPISLAGATAAELHAQLWLNTELNFDETCLMASTDDTHFYTDNAGTCFSGTSGGNFVPTTLDLNDMFTLGSLLGLPNVWVAVIFQSDFSNTFPAGAYVDDLLLRKCTGGTCTGVASSAPGGQLYAKTATLTRP